jgi:RHS repeat-associated protein
MGLETWPTAFPAEVVAWFYDAAENQWRTKLPEGLQPLSESPRILLPGQAAFVRSPSPLTQSPPDPALRIRYYHPDHLGSTTTMTDAAGALVEETAFYPYGRPRNKYQPRGLQNPYQFSEKERDAESGLSYFGQRFYSPTISRWISTDPLEEAGGGLNLYSYVRQNPLRYRDPNGAEVDITRNGHVLTINISLVIINDSPLVKQRGVDLKALSSDLQKSIQDTLQGSYKGTYKGKEGTWTVQTKVTSIKVVNSWKEITPGKKSPHVIRLLDQTEEAANTRRGGMLINVAAHSVTDKKPSDLTAEERANPANRSYLKGYESPGTIISHEIAHDEGLDHEPRSDHENLMSQGRWFDSNKLKPEQLQTIVNTITSGNVNNPADVKEAKEK